MFILPLLYCPSVTVNTKQVDRFLSVSLDTEMVGEMVLMMMVVVVMVVASVPFNVCLVVCSSNC